MPKPTDSNVRLAYSTGGEKEREGPREEPPVPSGTGLRLRLDRRKGDRLVTILSGLPREASHLKEFMRQLKVSLGAGGTIKGDSLEIQGDHRDRVEAALQERGLKWKRAGG